MSTIKTEKAVTYASNIYLAQDLFLLDKWFFHLQVCICLSTCESLPQKVLNRFWWNLAGWCIMIKNRFLSKMRWIALLYNLRNCWLILMLFPILDCKKHLNWLEQKIIFKYRKMSFLFVKNIFFTERRSEKLLTALFCSKYISYAGIWDIISSLKYNFEINMNTFASSVVFLWA